MFEDGQTMQEFLRDYYAIGMEGYLTAFGGTSPGLRRVADAYQVGKRDLKKILEWNESNYYRTQFGMEAEVWGAYNSEIAKLIDKKPITQVGDGAKYAKEQANFGFTPAAQLDTDQIFGTASEIVIDIFENILGSINKIPISQGLSAKIRESIPDQWRGGTDFQFLKNLSKKAFWNWMDTHLGGAVTADAHGVDTPAAKDIECLDRMISSKAESGGTTHVSSGWDGNVYWDCVGAGGGATQVDRSSTAWDSQLKLPTTVAATGKAWDILNELENLMVAAKKYSTKKRYIALMPDAAGTLIEREFSSESRHVWDGDSYVQENIGGVNTRAGAKYGHPVRSLILAGVTVPCFQSASALPSDNSKYTTTGWGHIYLIDLDSMYIRVDLPATYGETGWGIDAMVQQNYPRSRGVLMGVYQLVCTNFPANAKLCFLKNGSTLS